MTLCIGALAKVPSSSADSYCVVLCFDTKVGADEFASESEYKFHPLSNQFVALFAGRPGRAKELSVIYREHLKSIQPTEATILDDLREPLRTLKNRLADTYVKRRLAFSYRDLLDNGEQWIGKEMR